MTVNAGLRLCAFSCLLLSACGQVGPLYLPGQAPPSQQAPDTAPKTSPAPEAAAPGTDEEADPAQPNAAKPSQAPTQPNTP